MRVEDLMTRSVRTIAPEDPAEVAWSLMQRDDFHHLVVMDHGHAVGVLSRGDLGGLKGANRRKGVTASDLMTPSVVTATPTTTLRQAANLLRGYSIGCLPVLRGKTLVGILTVTDLLDAYGRGDIKPAPARWKPTYRSERWPRVPPGGPESRRH